MIEFLFIWLCCLALFLEICHRAPFLEGQD